SDDLAINGPGAPSLAISSNHPSDPILSVEGVEVSLEELTVGPSSAGGIEVAAAGTLTVNRCVIAGNITSNIGGGIHNGGTLAVMSSTFLGNHGDGETIFAGGGAISNDGTLTVTNSTFSGNTAFFGTAIFNAGTLTVTNSTFSGNAGDGTCFG